MIFHKRVFYYFNKMVLTYEYRILLDNFFRLESLKYTLSFLSPTLHKLSSMFTGV